MRFLAWDPPHTLPQTLLKVIPKLIVIRKDDLTNKVQQAKTFLLKIIFFDILRIMHRQPTKLPEKKQQTLQRIGNKQWGEECKQY